MRILFISGQNIDFDGRTKALIEILDSFAHVTVVSRLGSGKDDFLDEDSIRIAGGYSGFIKKAVDYASDLRDIDCVFVDNRQATVPALRIIDKINPKLVIYDARELYLYREMNTIKSRIGCRFEDKMIKKADLVIAANEERKNIMEKAFDTNATFMVFENFRQLQYTDEEAKKQAEDQFKQYFDDNDVFNIISTAGCDLSRMTDKLVRSMKDFDFKARLVLLGCKGDQDEEVCRRIAKDNRIDNVLYLPRVDLNGVKYIISQCQVGVAMYHKENANNLYCSSGKIYEFLYEGLPIATSTNPTMKRVIDTYGVGACSDNIGAAIKEVHDNYNGFRQNVEDFVAAKVVETEQQNFRETLKEFLTAELGD